MAEPAALVPLVDPRALPQLRPQPAAAAPRLSVVIVNYCQWDDTAALVRQLRASRAARRGEAEVVVVDNHSPPHRALRRLRRARGVSVRRWGRNRGFARGVNEGCRLSRGDCFLLLNPDVSVTPDFLDEALRLADELTAMEPQVGVVGLRLRDANGALQPSCGPFPTFAGTLAGLVLPRSRRKCRPVRGTVRQPIDWVTGCGLLVRRACFEDLGGLDRRFFLYYEDVDFCRRARARGWTVWHEPRLQAVHHKPLHRRRVSPLIRVVTRHALLTYAALHWPTWQMQLLARIIGVEAWARALWAGWRGDGEARRLFRQLRRLAREMRLGQRRRARRRLDRLLLRQEARFR